MRQFSLSVVIRELVRYIIDGFGKSLRIDRPIASKVKLVELGVKITDSRMYVLLRAGILRHAHTNDSPRGQVFLFKITVYRTAMVAPSQRATRIAHRNVLESERKMPLIR